ncbi:MAG: dipeptide epimerase [Bacteroidales bacterium]|nr:dipeptide epimerase [Bacteroidales bacterium]
MQVVDLEVRHIRLPLRRPVKHASHTRTDTDNVLVRCTLSDGSVGWGEGVPRDYVTGETVDSAIALMRRSNIAARISECQNFEDAVRMVSRFALDAVPGDERGCQGNAARCAVELALLDAFGHAFGEPLTAVTRFVAPELYELQEQVRYSGVILSAKGWKARVMSLAYRLTGFRQCKVKVGIAGHDDVQRLRLIRRCLGSAMDIRLDANEAWDIATAIRQIQALAPYQITSVEQPVPHELSHELASVRKQTGIPIMLDESLCSEIDAERVTREGLCDLFNLRLSKCGGFLPTLRLAAFAARHGLGYQLGCQVGETAILSAAGRHFACSVAGIRAWEGSFDRYLHRHLLTREDLTFGRGGVAPRLVGPGLGITVDPVRVDAITVHREVLIG